LRHVSDVVVSPGFAPDHPLVTAAVAAGLEVYSEPELAWRLRRPRQDGVPAPWLAVTGTNGKTTTVTMLEAVLRAQGWRTAALGNVGEPLVDAVLKPPAEQYDVIAVELSSFQLHWSSQLAPRAGALLNLADDHLDWHGGFDRYAAAKTEIWRAAGAADGDRTGVRDGDRTGGDRDVDRAGGDRAGAFAVGNSDDPRVAELLAAVPGGVGFTLSEPAPSQFGIADDVLVDRAFGGGAFGDAVELMPVAEIRLAGRHNLANALAAAALARGYGAAPEAVRSGLAGYAPQPHRNAPVATVGGVSYVDDSKATNPHAAASSLRAYPRVVWLAGGQLKGVDVEDLVSGVADRLVGVVLIGVDRAQIADAVRRHAPQVPLTDVPRTDDGAMAEAVAAAMAMARPGDTVLLAPAAASYDMFSGYVDRGRQFATAVAGLPPARG
ncbi:MAG: Mur ligase family protein, partial [Micromonosporaceae bacterium]